MCSDILLLDALASAAVPTDHLALGEKASVPLSCQRAIFMFPEGERLRCLYSDEWPVYKDVMFSECLVFSDFTHLLQL